MLTEADTCRKFVVPKLQVAGWDAPPHAINEQRTFTDGRIVFVGGKARRGKQKRADYLLRYRPDFPIAIVEAKARYKQAGDGIQQAKDYAEILGLKFAYATNGIEIIEFDYTTGVERTVSEFPEPNELWHRLRASEGIADDGVAEKLLTPAYPDKAKPLRYYQEIAVNRAVQAVLQGQNRVPLTLCTGAGKTAVAFQIAWKLWSGRWNTKGISRKPKILFLADRNVLVDDPMAKDFGPFGDAQAKLPSRAKYLFDRGCRSQTTRWPPSALAKEVSFRTGQSPTRLYRYYASMDLIRNRPTGETCGPLRLPAGMVEDAVIGEIRRMIRAPEIVARTIRALREESSTVDEKAVVKALGEFDQLWAALYPAEQTRIIQLLVERVTVGEDGIAVDLRHEGLGSVLRDMMAPRRTEARA